MGRRRTARADQSLRELLLKEWRERFGPTSRWHIPGRVSEYEAALAAGEPVVIDSSTLLCTLLHAGLPCDDFAFGGQHWDKQWLLDEDGTLSEYTPEDDPGVAGPSGPLPGSVLGHPDLRVGFGGLWRR